MVGPGILKSKEPKNCGGEVSNSEKKPEKKYKIEDASEGSVENLKAKCKGSDVARKQKQPVISTLVPRDARLRSLNERTGVDAKASQAFEKEGNEDCLKAKG